MAQATQKRTHALANLILELRQLQPRSRLDARHARNPPQHTNALLGGREVMPTLA